MAATSMHGIMEARALRQQLVKYEEGVSWPRTCKDVKPGEENRPLLKDVTKKRSEDRD
jgi:hypothetical protein